MVLKLLMFKFVLSLASQKLSISLFLVRVNGDSLERNENTSLDECSELEETQPLLTKNDQLFHSRC